MMFFEKKRKEKKRSKARTLRANFRKAAQFFTILGVPHLYCHCQ